MVAQSHCCTSASSKIWRYLSQHHPFEALMRSDHLNRWSDHPQSVIRSPSISGQIALNQWSVALNQWSDRPQSVIRSPSISGQIALNQWSDRPQSVIRSPSISDQIALNQWSDCPGKILILCIYHLSQLLYVCDLPATQRRGWVCLHGLQRGEQHGVTYLHNCDKLFCHSAWEYKHWYCFCRVPLYSV